MKWQYHGWSGFTFEHDGIVVRFDPPRGPVAEPSSECVVTCITHGHPDHFEGIRELGRTGSSWSLARTHVVSTPQVVRHLSKTDIRHLHVLRGGETTTIANLRVEAFWCDHMPLLPPERELRRRFARSFAAHPITCGRIALRGLTGPLTSPMLGFRVRFPDRVSVLYLGEGLHRETRLNELSRLNQDTSPDFVAFGLEPEDEERCQTWLTVLDAETALIYEPHRPWRDALGLGRVCLPALSERLNGALHRTHVVTCPHLSAGEDHVA